MKLKWLRVKSGQKDKKTQNKRLSSIYITCNRFRAELACHRRRAGRKRKANDGWHSRWWQAAEQEEKIRKRGGHHRNPVPRPGHPLHDLCVPRLLRPRPLLRRLQILVLFKLISLFLCFFWGLLRRSIIFNIFWALSRNKKWFFYLFIFGLFSISFGY